jgi:enoyl-CoA hydratase/carnithine racemase
MQMSQTDGVARLTDLQEAIVEVSEPIAIVRFNRPQALNAVTPDTHAELVRIFTAIGDDPSIRVAILTGAGDKSFCVGSDIKRFTTIDSIAADLAQPQGLEQNRYLEISVIEGLGKPVIAAVNGYCLGGGLEIAMACDFMIASDRATFGFPEAKLGLFPSNGTQRLARLIGRNRALELILTAATIPAVEAERIGLVNRVVPHAQLMTETEGIARTMAALGPVALRMTRESIIRGLEMHLQDALHEDEYRHAVLCTTEDRLEGAKAFKEKRPARFAGR